MDKASDSSPYLTTAFFPLRKEDVASLFRQETQIAYQQTTSKEAGALRHFLYL